VPRELRHKFVSLLSSDGMPLKDIAEITHVARQPAGQIKRRSSNRASALLRRAPRQATLSDTDRENASHQVVPSGMVAVLSLAGGR
jgi:hypothetical protein